MSTVAYGTAQRSVTGFDQRISEAQKLGFETIIVPANNLKGVHATTGIKVIEVSKVEEAFAHLFG